MEIQYHGANALRISTKKNQLVIDPLSDITSLNTDMKKATIMAVTQPELGDSTYYDDCFRIESPGEYEFADLSVKGVGVQAATAASGDKSAVMYRVTSQDTVVLIAGHVNEVDAEAALEEMGVVDILILPVGGSGYTMDAAGAANLVRSVEPKLVIPVHYADGTKYEVPQQDLELFIKELGAPILEEKVDKLKLKSLPELLSVQILNKS